MQRGGSPPDSESVGEFDHAQSVPSLKYLDSLELHLSQHPFRMEMFTMWPPQVTSGLDKQLDYIGLQSAHQELNPGIDEGLLHRLQGTENVASVGCHINS
ncbi:Acidic leucine-rich nuclear phosphoprotein 32-related protein [Dissostichus eleginoides]|uniref:Acidic leucine-rich nuclear phosphoprotein 32-related protein n=1 Tax=Dissostichus eleginoides TaxID=100907 RepID=A0AAD9C0B1_DISEL|nr:Acidic leucine-rich nuclear phosphoprotein 32-related protein [Dissostichus eleginoides]